MRNIISESSNLINMIWDDPKKHLGLQWKKEHLTLSTKSHMLTNSIISLVIYNLKYVLFNLHNNASCFKMPQSPRTLKQQQKVMFISKLFYPGSNLIFIPRLLDPAVFAACIRWVCVCVGQDNVKESCVTALPALMAFCRHTPTP